MTHIFSAVSLSGVASTQTNAEEGGKVWSNTNETFSSLPSSLVEATQLQTDTPIPANTPLVLDITKPTTVNIAVEQQLRSNSYASSLLNDGSMKDSNVYVTSLLNDGWVKEEDEIVTTKRTLAIYAKMFTENVTLPTSTEDLMIVLFVKGNNQRE